MPAGILYFPFGTFPGEGWGPGGEGLGSGYLGDPASLAAAVRGATGSSSGSGLPGISTPVAAGGILLLIVLGLAGVLGIGVLSADGMAPWEVRRKERSRWIHRHPWSWHG